MKTRHFFFSFLVFIFVSAVPAREADGTRVEQARVELSELRRGYVDTGVIDWASVSRIAEQYHADMYNSSGFSKESSRFAIYYIWEEVVSSLASDPDYCVFLRELTQGDDEKSKYLVSSSLIVAARKCMSYGEFFEIFDLKALKVNIIEKDEEGEQSKEHLIIAKLLALQVYTESGSDHAINYVSGLLESADPNSIFALLCARALIEPAYNDKHAEAIRALSSYSIDHQNSQNL